GRKRPKLVNGGFVPRSSGPRRLEGAVRVEVEPVHGPDTVDLLRMTIVVSPDPSNGTSSTRPDVVRTLPNSVPPTPTPMAIPAPRAPAVADSRSTGSAATPPIVCVPPIVGSSTAAPRDAAVITTRDFM